MRVDRFIEGGGDDLGVNRAVHVRHFFRALADQRHHQVHIGIIGRDRVGDLLQDGRFSCFGRRDDQAALALADRSHQVDHARGEREAVGLEVETFEREDRRQLFKARAVLGFLGIHPVDRFDP